MITYIELDWLISMLVSHRSRDTVPIIVILDCCRTEVAVRKMQTDHANLVEGEGGPSNVFIMYATGSNHTASDGTGANGAFTGFLLQHMDTTEDIDNRGTQSKSKSMEHLLVAHPWLRRVGCRVI